MAKKVTEMLLKIHDLEWSKSYKKVKKILCKFPQIQDQVYDEKNNTVRIKVVCCSPEKIRDKICCKGRGTIKSIEILKPPEKKVGSILKPSEKKVEPTPTPPASVVNIEVNTTIDVNFFDVPVHCSCGCGGRRCIECYFIEDNSQGCTIL